MVKNNRVLSQAHLLGVIAHPTRLMILEELSRGTKCVNDIQEILGVLQPNVSQHLSVLKENNMVTCDKDGTSRCYRLAKPVFVKGLLAALGNDVAVPKTGDSGIKRERKKLQ